MIAKETLRRIVSKQKKELPPPPCAIHAYYALDESNRKREISGLLSAMNAFKLKEGLILTFEQTEELEMEGKKIRILPAFRWMSG